MSIDIRNLVIDIKAAARIGHAESVWLALEGLFELPQTAANAQMNQTFIERVILPVGEALVSPNLKTSVIKPLANEPYAALRAVTAVALAHRYFMHDDVKMKYLKILGRDSRADVRLALQLALAQAGAQQPEKLCDIAEKWLAANSPRQQAIAILLLAGLPDRALPFFQSFPVSANPEVRRALVDALTALALNRKQAEVLDLLKIWTEETQNNVWLIAKTLSSSWAAAHAHQALEIVANLARQHGPEKQLINTLKALQRHGAEDTLQASLNAWRNDPDTHLRTLAQQALDKL
jgi:hypothetical protein